MVVYFYPIQNDNPFIRVAKKGCMDYKRCLSISNNDSHARVFRSILIDFHSKSKYAVRTS